MRARTAAATCIAGRFFVEPSSFCKANGRFGVLVSHAQACPKVSNVDAAFDELRRGGIQVGEMARRRGEGSTPRRPPNCYVKEEDWTPSPKSVKKSKGRDFKGPPNESGRERYRRFQNPIRATSPRRNGKGWQSETK